MNKKYLLAPITAALIVSAAACGPAHTATPQQKTSVSALASVPGADAKQILINAGVPVNGTSAEQIAFVKSMLASKKNRDALLLKLDIPPQNVSVFQSKMLDAAKADDVLTSHAGRVKFLDVDLPDIYAQEA